MFKLEPVWPIKCSVTVFDTSDLKPLRNRHVDSFGLIYLLVFDFRSIRIKYQTCFHNLVDVAR